MAVATTLKPTAVSAARRPRWSWRHDALVLLAAVALVARAHVRAQDDSSSTGDESSSTGDASTGVTGNHTHPNRSSNVPFLPYPRPNVTTAYCGLTEPEAVRWMDNTTVCFVVGGKAKILFYVNVDEFCAAQITAPKNATAAPNRTGTWDHPGLWFQAEYGPKASPMKWRHPQVSNTSDVYGYVVPFWTLVITLKDGLVTDLTWDDGCFGCSGDACVEETCAVDPDATGCTDPNSRADCNPKFFISWFGTDRNGQYLTSAGSRFSRFRQYSVSSAFNSAYQTTTDAFDSSVRNPNLKPFDTLCTEDPNDPTCEREPGT